MMCIALGIGLPFRLSAIGSVIPSAALSLDFTSGTLDNRITFSRASGATYTDAQGNLAFSSINLVLRSEEFENTYWDKNAGLVSALDNQTTAPDSSQTASLLTEVAGTGSHHLHNATGGFTPVVGTKYCMSVYLKQPATNADRYIQLAFWSAGFGLNAYTNYDLLNKTATFNASAINTSGVEVLDNGWMRVWSVATATATSASGFQVAFVSSGTAPRAESYTVTAGTEESVYIYGAMLAASSVLTPYAATTTAATGAPRFDYDPVTLEAKGLLIEEARTNLVKQSEDFTAADWIKTNATVTANDVVAPDGNTTADTLTSSSANAVIKQAVITTAVPMSFSVYLKRKTGTGSIDISVDGTTFVTQTINSSGWTRCIVTQTAVAGTSNPSIRIVTSTDAVYAWGAQLEAGSFATSYIPTTGAQATRAADLAVITGTNFSSWYNQSEGTIYTETDQLTGVSTTTMPYCVSNGTFNNSHYSNYSNGNSFRGSNYVVNGNSSGESITTVTGIISTSVLKDAFAYKVNDFAESTNGSSARVDTNGPINSNLDRMYIGSNWSGSNNFLNGHIKSLKFWNSRLSNTQLQTITDVGYTVAPSNSIGVAGTKGFGVGVAPSLPSGFSALIGTDNADSENYGNYVFQDGSVMVWIPAFYMRLGHVSNSTYATYGVNSIEVKGLSDFANEAAANADGFYLHRAFVNAGTNQLGFFRDKYDCSLNGTTASSIKGVQPMVSGPVAGQVGFTGATANGQTPANIYAGSIAASKSRGSKFVPETIFMADALTRLSEAHAQSSNSSTYCAWWSSGLTNFPKGNNNNALKDINDNSVTFTSAGNATYPAFALAGSGAPFAKTTHNGQACGVADVNGNIYKINIGMTCIATSKVITAATKTNPVTVTATAHGLTTGATVMIDGVLGMTQLNQRIYIIEATDTNTLTLTGVDGTAYGTYTSGGSVVSGKFYSLKPSVNVETLTSGNTLTTDAWGATGVAANYDEISLNLVTAPASNTSNRRFGNSSAQVFGWSTAAERNMSMLGMPAASGTSASGTAAFGNDLWFQYIRNELCVISRGRWSNGGDAGVRFRDLTNARTTANNAVGFAASRYL